MKGLEDELERKITQLNLDKVYVEADGCRGKEILAAGN